MASKIIVQRRFVPIAPNVEGSSLSRLLGYAGIEQAPQIWLGSRLLLAITVAIMAFAIPPIICYAANIDIGFGLPGNLNMLFMTGYMFLAAMVGFATVLMLAYLHLYYVIHDRTHRVEEVLPDFLLMVAAQMHAGLTPFAAINAAHYN